MVYASMGQGVRALREEVLWALSKCWEHDVRGRGGCGGNGLMSFKGRLRYFQRGVEGRLMGSIKFYVCTDVDSGFSCIVMKGRCFMKMDTSKLKNL